MDKNETVVEFERVMAFLENNQLIQACAIVQRLENSFRDEISKSKISADLHPVWQSFKAVLRTKALLLAGNRDGAEEEWKTALRTVKIAL